MKKYVMSVTKVDNKVIMDKLGDVDKIGGHPTYLPPENTDIFGYFVMELYNKEPIHGREDVLCWQFYQDEFGGPIVNVIAIPKGAKHNIDKKIPIRRWIDEYIINYEEIEEDESEFDDVAYYENYISAIGGKTDDDILDDCECAEVEYVGIIFDELCPDNDLNLGYMHTIIGLDSDGNLVAI